MLELKRVDLANFFDKSTGALETVCGSNDMTSKAIFVKGNMINGELQGIYSGELINFHFFCFTLESLSLFFSFAFNIVAWQGNYLSTHGTVTILLTLF